MDGYHIYRKDLNEEGVRRRGAPFTFDFVRLRKDLIKLRETGEGAFPAFDHAVKDPEENAIIVTKNDKVIIIEGLYLFLKELDLTGIFDYKLFIDRKFDEKVIGARHFNCGIEDSLEKGIQRAIDNDKVNAEYIMENSDFSNVKFIK
jgi:pantothenate kinase